MGAGGSCTRILWGRSLGLAIQRIVRGLASLRNRASSSLMRREQSYPQSRNVFPFPSPGPPGISWILCARHPLMVVLHLVLHWSHTWEKEARGTQGVGRENGETQDSDRRIGPCWRGGMGTGGDKGILEGALGHDWGTRHRDPARYPEETLSKCILSGTSSCPDPFTQHPALPPSHRAFLLQVP